jgi:hypothetical protein
MRSRILKPDFFRNEELAELPFEARLLFAGLWCVADREGRLADRPKRIAADVFPYDKAIDGDRAEAMLKALYDRGFILRYCVQSENFIQIVSFKKHQSCHQKEAASIIPAPDKHVASPEFPDAPFKDPAPAEEPEPVKNTSPDDQDLSTFAVEIRNIFPADRRGTLQEVERAIAGEFGPLPDNLMPAAMEQCRRNVAAYMAGRDVQQGVCMRCDRWIKDGRWREETPPPKLILTPKERARLMQNGSLCNRCGERKPAQGNYICQLCLDAMAASL